RLGADRTTVAIRRPPLGRCARDARSLTAATRSRRGLPRRRAPWPGRAARRLARAARSALGARADRFVRPLGRPAARWLARERCRASRRLQAARETLGRLLRRA